MDSLNKIKILLIFLAIDFYSHLYGNDTVYIKFIWNSSATNILQLENISEVDFEPKILIKKEIQKNTILDTFIVIKKEAFFYLKDGFGQHTFF